MLDAVGDPLTHCMIYLELHNSYCPTCAKQLSRHKLTPSGKYERRQISCLHCGLYFTIKIEKI